MKSKIATYAFHIFFCVSFLVVSYLFTPGGSLSFPDVIHAPEARGNFIIFCLLIGVFYFNYYFLIPYVYFQKKYILYFSLILLGVLFINYFPSKENEFAHHRPAPPPGNEQFPPFANEQPSPANNSFSTMEKSHFVFLFLIGIFASLFIKSHNRFLKTEKDKLDAELSFLKAQINPHFLFNTLNSIYSLAINKDERTPDAIVQLSELMRYIIRDANNNFVALERELNYIDNYIALQKARLGTSATINYTKNGEAIGKKIAPLILISFVENAFKHGINPDDESEINIAVAMKEDLLSLKVYNRKVKKSGTYFSEEGIGISNTKQRLEMVYPAKHSLFIDDKAESFLIDLSINLV